MTETGYRAYTGIDMNQSLHKSNSVMRAYFPHQNKLNCCGPVCFRFNSRSPAISRLVSLDDILAYCCSSIRMPHDTASF